jgi:hypothetical protein
MTTAYALPQQASIWWVFLLQGLPESFRALSGSGRLTGQARHVLVLLSEVRVYMLCQRK